MTDEQPLPGGNASDFVVRSGDTVRKPWTETTGKVHRYLQRLRTAGADVPRVGGPDSEGRQVLEYIDGMLAIERGQFCVEELQRVGGIIRAIHDSSPRCTPADLQSWPVLIPAPEQELICHNDLAPWNLILGDRWVFVDWDGAGPSSRMWDLAYAAQSFAGLWEGEDPETAGVRLRAFADGYGASWEQRRQLPEMLVRRVQAMYALLRDANETGFQPWARMYDEGHGAHWRATSDFVYRHIGTWRKAIELEDGPVPELPPS